MSKWLKYITAGITGALTTIPEEWRWLAYTALAFFVCDTLTGLWIACHEHRVSSNKMRTQTFAKLLQYGTIFVLCYFVHRALGHHEWIIIVGIGFIASVEFHSNVENLVKLQKYGVDMGPLKPFLDRIGKYIDPAVLVPAEKRTGPEGVSDEPAGHSDRRGPSVEDGREAGSVGDAQRRG